MQNARPVRTTAAAVSVTLVGLVLAGCAETAQQAAQQAGLTPAARVDAAVSSVLDTDRLTVTASLDLDDANRAAISALATEDGAVSAAVVERVLGTRLVATTVSSEGELSDLDLSAAGGVAAVPDSLSASVAMEVDGESLAELRQVGGTVYARVDLPAIEAAYEVEGMTDDLTTGLTEAPAEVAGAAEALVAGDWVSVDTADLTARLEELGLTAPPSGSQDTERATAAVEGFLSEAAAVLRKEVVVTETGADAYDVTAPLDKVLTSLTPSLTALVGELVTSTGALEGLEGTPGADPDALAQEVTSGVQETLEGLQDELAGRSATVQVGLDGERLASARLDVVQLVDDETRAEMAADDVTALPVLLTFAHEGEVSAPEGATAVDLAGLLDGAAGAGLVPGMPMGDLLGDAVAVPGSEDDLMEEDLGAPMQIPTADLEAMGLTAEALEMDEDEYAAYLAEVGIEPIP